VKIKKRFVMFKFLKDKLKKAVSIFSKKVEEEAEVKKEVKEITKEEVKIEEKIKEVKEKKISKPAKAPEEPVHVKEEIEEAIVEEKHEIEAKEEIKKEEPEVKAEEEKPKEEVLPEFEEEEIKETKQEPEKEEIKEQIESQLKELKEGVEKEFKEIKPEPEKEEKQEKLSFFQKIFGKKHEEEPAKAKKEAVKEEIKEKEILVEEVKEKKKPEVKEIEKAVEKKKEKEIKTLVAAGAEKVEIEEEPERKKGLFGRIKETLTTVKLSDEKFEKLFWELEVVLMENNVAVEVIDKIKADLREELTTGKVSRKGIEGLVEDSLRESVNSLFIDKHFNLIEEVKKKKTKPYIVAFIGVNGSGKTTTMAKIASLLLKNKLSVVFAASDTFRAAAIQQLQEHADKLGVKMIRHDYESDPAAVAFDAVQHAKAKGIDVVLIDTAGRLHVNDNLMNELKKLIRVNKPDLKIFVGESITGNDCIEQAQLFNESVGIDAIILAKADVDEKGGAAVSVSYVTKKPIIYLGTGQKYEDLTEFKPEIIIKNIGL
jgi:fused signal recognition particle receptor